MFLNKNFFAVYEIEHQQCSHGEYRSLKLEQWKSHAEYTHTIDMICSEIDSKSWTPNRALHLSYVECIANNKLDIGEKKYDELRDIELDVNTFLKMLTYSAGSLEVIELYVSNKNHNNRSDFFYSIMFDEFRYKLKATLDIEHVFNILAEHSKHVKDLAIQFVDEYFATMESFVKSRERLESLRLFGCNIDLNFIFGNLKSGLKKFSLDYGKFKAENEKNADAVLNQLESLNLNSNNFACLETLQSLRLKLCFLSDSDFQFLIRCKHLKSVTLDHCYGTEDNRIIHGFLSLPAIEKFVLTRTYFVAFSPCNTLKVLHLEPTQWHIDEKVLTQIFEQMPNLRYLKVLQSTECTAYFTDQVYKLMKSVLSNSDLTFVMYRKTYDNYTDGDVIVVEKDPSKVDCVNFDFESTFFLDFFPNYDVFESFKEALQRDGLNYHIKCIIHHKYDYKQMDF